MTRVRWTTDAADDLASIVTYIRKDNPEAARRVAKAIFEGVAQLRTFPKRGRIGLAKNTRELVLLPGRMSQYTRSTKVRCMCSVSDMHRTIGRKCRDCRSAAYLRRLPPTMEVPAELQDSLEVYSFNNARRRLVCTRLTGISVCFLSSIRS
jgi:plasmid stabilization system protein ParE